MDINKKLVFVVNVDWFFISHRLPIAVKAISNGYEVHLICKDTGKCKELVELGINVHDCPFTRNGSKLFSEINSLLKLKRLIKKINPDIVHAVTIKPVLYTGLVLHLVKKKPKFVAAISGLGYVFTAENFKAKLTKSLVSILYRVAFHHKDKLVIFQNMTDQSILKSVTNFSESESVLIKGSGADLQTYNYTKEPDVDVIKIVMACRLLKEKGVYEYVEAAKIVREKYKNVDFLLAGSPDDNPNSISQIELDAWNRDGIITTLGHCNNIPKIFSESHIITMPSYYGEGVPKVLIEAAACGRPIITTDNPGCRDSIIPDVSGILVPIKDAISLAKAIILLIENNDLRVSMGEQGRQYAEQEFDVKAVVQKHMMIYSQLLL
ncbi:glycosyltransferase family 1 protein [Psychromonas sp. RZ22]|uniref:glycosyltransferase family 4 protein n=1 Tax=Psychromonas algarum TaxID=2555643 RepID=UPI001068A8A2|nr:glycosyltransferase family 4 protein [Psychromonas sp. RZ22]TEW55726.1 glycosyltransferase family 1 protein [Psychromonas sp. RZ22]